MAVIEAEEDSTVRSTLGVLREKCSLLSETLELELRIVCKENALLAVTVHVYEVQVKHLEVKVGEKKYIGMA